MERKFLIIKSPKIKKRKNRNHLKKESRRGFLFKSILGLASLVGSYLYLRFESNWLETTRKKVVIHSLKNKTPIRLLHLSDLHFSNTVSLENIDFALHTAYSLLPDICVITGDFITDQKTDNELKDMSRILSKYARKIPTFASLEIMMVGNGQDQGVDRKVVRK